VYYETSEWKLGHSASSPDEKWLVTDSQDIDENILMLVSTQRDEQHMLCWPNMSQKGSTRPHKRNPTLPPHTDTDTHPGWSATGRYVHYTSDISGRSQIYVVPVSDLAGN
jgi:Tol biopolymer transport system component